MKEKIKHYIKEIALFLIVMTIFANIISLYKSSDLNKNPLTLTNISLITGEKYALSQDKPTLIHIWAIWCPTCKVEASNIQTLSEHYNVLTIAVKSGSNDDIQSWLKESEYTFNVVNDSSGFIASNFQVGVYPTTLIYDKDKNLIFSDVGYTSTIGLVLRMWWAGL
ncbi:MAG: thiol-disulfide isomerase/thioredoxin [Sulfurimonas sp.]|jgi:thiol-disulfide isomerase/thioredoxin|uniref:redoxin domain-containing protein n=1 Tax=Sulfurimonas sp. TaxID=2022749 RepID=UPI0039E61A1E